MKPTNDGRSNSADGTDSERTSDADGTDSEQTPDEPLARFVELQLDGEGVVIYDDKIHTAWIQSEDAVPVAEVR